MHNNTIIHADQPIKDHPHALMPPHTDKLLHLLKPIWYRQAHTTVDTRQVTQVENIVEL